MNPTGTKREIRQHMLAMLRAVPMQQRDADSTLLRQQLSPYLNGSKQLTVGIYMPMPHEVDLLPLLREYPQHKYAVPRCLPGRQLCFHRISDAEKDTETGAHGIPAPKAELPQVLPQDIDILIIPGVAFTRQGERLGYGGGYYDRYIPQCTNAHKVALAFAQQILPHLPTEPHDLKTEHLIHL
jgi:5-formyltetrahydrofolate cyclo-ligase